MHNSHVKWIKKGWRPEIYILHKQILKPLSFWAAMWSRLTYPLNMYPKSKEYDNSSTVKRFSSQLVFFFCELNPRCSKTQAVHTLTVQQSSHLRLIPTHTAQAFEVYIIPSAISGLKVQNLTLWMSDLSDSHFYNNPENENQDPEIRVKLINPTF